jgi:RNA polymerase sigma-70 factor (sigma-E family)
VRDAPRRAYREFVELRIPQWRRTAYLLCQDWNRADDLVQGAALRLFVHWGAASRANNLDAYAQTVLVRVFLDDQRSLWRRRVLLENSMPEQAAPAPDHSTRLQVRAALATLPPRQRATVVLRFFCDLSVEQTAEVLGCSTGTVKSQTARGLDALRSAFATVERG